MREILFRGKREDNNEWIVGNLVIWSDKSTSIDNCGDAPFYAVDPATVGQYTGLTDVYGEKIFEGDIVVNSFPTALSTRPHVVRYRDGVFIYVSDWINSEFGPRPVRIIGNIYDNPELLKED